MHNSKILSAIILVFLTYIPGFAQFGIGVKGAQNFNKIYCRPVIDQKLLKSNAYGLLIRYISEPHIGVQAEFLYTTKGWSEKDKFNPDFKYMMKTNYIEMPILAHFYFGKKTRITLNIGCYVAYVVDKQEIIGDSVKVRSNPIKSYNNKDFGVCGGVGFEQTTPIGTFALEARYNHGFLNVFEREIVHSVYMAQNQSFSINLIYIFGFNKPQNQTENTNTP